MTTGFSAELLDTADAVANRAAQAILCRGKGYFY